MPRRDADPLHQLTIALNARLEAHERLAMLDASIANHRADPGKLLRLMKARPDLLDAVEEADRAVQRFGGTAWTRRSSA